MSAEERLADRRERLILAAYTLFANPGFHATTIERLCATARISNRAFYECFSGREALMRAVYDRCVEETLQVVAKAIDQAPRSLDARIVAGITEYVRFVTQDERRARIMHLEVRRAGDVLSNARQRAVAGFTHVIEGTVNELPERIPNELHLLALALIGAITELLIEWVVSDNPPSIEVIIKTSVHVFRRSFQL
ncbi:TetR/AcrR family transcriptional regulator [Acrocarpospora catenulata]|uniref:TetR/AcrR family transcriptional regulator n=1 Tax=Acrocarpospora catenulata TaxID=2836182 RepID=UPI001BDB4854|nr:TetR/AcrR family transcriptional regulator [Acrocarpospora catenulata]